MTEIFKELKRTVCIYDPLIIKLNRHIYYQDRDLGGIFCPAVKKIDTELFDEGIRFQNPKSLSYHIIKCITLKIKYARVEFI